MGLDADQLSLLRRLTECARGTGDRTFLLCATMGGSRLMGTETGFNLTDVPDEEAFYELLAAQGMLHLGHSSHGGLKVTPLPAAYDAVALASKPAPIRWALQRKHELSGGRPLWPGTVKAVALMVVGSIITLAMQAVARWLGGP